MRANALDSDYGYISTLRQRHGLPEDTPTQTDLSFLLDAIQQKREEMGMSREDWFALYPSVDSSRVVFQNMAANKELSKKEREKYSKALERLDEPRALILPIGRNMPGKPEPVVATRLARVFVNDHGVVTIPLKGIAAKQIMFGLTKIHKPEAISRREKTIKLFGKSVKVTLGSQCPACTYSADNHDSINNHVRAHWRIVLLCGICLRVEPTTSGMLSHGKEEHHLNFRDADK